MQHIMQLPKATCSMHNHTTYCFYVLFINICSGIETADMREMCFTTTIAVLINDKSGGDLI